MKTLKALLLLVVFCLTVSGSSYDVKPEIDNTFKVNKDDFKFSGPVKKGGTGLDPMGIVEG